MKIAIYSSFKGMHYECLGYLIEYFKYFNFKLDYYLYIIDEIEKEWITVYEKLFNIKINLYNPELFKNIYNYVFIVTDDDVEFTDNKNNKNIICINHNYKIRRYNVYKYINTRFFPFSKINNWSLPCYMGINKKEKQELILKSNKITILLLGTRHIPKSIDLLKNLFINFNQIEFIIISRYILNNNVNFKDYENIKVYKYCPVDKMIDILKNTDYVLCLNYEKTYINETMSGCIPLAFSFGCQLIIPKEWELVYNYKSCIIYDETTTLNLTKNNNLNLIYEDNERLINHRNNMLNNFLKINNNIYGKNNLINITLKNLKLNIPLILIYSDIELKININEYINDYNIIYIIIDNYNYIYDDNKIRLYNIDFINKLNIIKEPILYLINNNKYIENELKKLGKRHYQDIILIHNIYNYDLEKLIKIYNKYVHIYYLTNNYIILYSFK